jgi:D-alanyl-D-alanine dipeptidase
MEEIFQIGQKLKSDLVNVKEYIPDIVVDLKYATDDNFTGHRIYDFAEAYLRYGTVQKLTKVQEKLREMGLSLKIWDAYRPTAAQFTFWELCPDDTFVADPYKGFSSHSRGNAVDVTLVTAEGAELLTPTAFDDFSERATRHHAGWNPEAARNVQLVEDLLVQSGFRAYEGEWWHYVDLDVYPVEEKLK